MLAKLEEWVDVLSGAYDVVVGAIGFLSLLVTLVAGCYGLYKMRMEVKQLLATSEPAGLAGSGSP